MCLVVRLKQRRCSENGILLIPFIIGPFAHIVEWEVKQFWEQIYLYVVERKFNQPILNPSCVPVTHVSTLHMWYSLPPFNHVLEAQSG